MTTIRVSVTLPDSCEQVVVARHWLAAWLGDGHPATDTAVLLLSEVFANSCAHSRSAEEGGTIEVTAELSGQAVRVQVVDDGGGPELLVVTEPADDAEEGRGLWLLDLLAKEWGSRRLPDGRFGVTFSVGF